MGVAALLQAADARLAAKTDGEHGGLFVALQLAPEAAAAIALPGGEAPEQLHVTLAYCDDAGALGPAIVGAAAAAVEAVARRFPPLEGAVGGGGRFAASPTSDGKEVAWASPDVPRMSALREAVAQALAAVGAPPRDEHGWAPHVTLAYVDPGAPQPPLPPPAALRFDAVLFDGRRPGDPVEFPLSGTALTAALVEADQRATKMEHAPGFVEHPLVEHVGTATTTRPDVVPPRRVLVAHGEDDLVARVAAAARAACAAGDAWPDCWRRIEPEARRVVADAAARATGNGADQATQARLEALGQRWLDAYAGPGMARRLGIDPTDGPALRDALERVVQTLVRRLLSLGAVVAYATPTLGAGGLGAALKHADRVLALKYPKRRPLTPPPADQTAGEARYVIVNADDEAGTRTGTPTCPICSYMADVGSFRVADALGMLDGYDAVAGEGDAGVRRTVEGFPFLTKADVEAGYGVRELTAMGAILPGFHPHCRCTIALV